MSGRFFTPPKLKPLGLKLRSLSGGGYAPSQYDGETMDGRHVYCRYRGGQLSVDVARAPGGDALEDGETVLKHMIGPPLDGFVSMKQLCRLAGITVLDMHAQGADDGEESDLSGAVTFWFFSVPATEQGAKAFVQGVWRRLPVAAMTETSWGQPGGPQERAIATGQVPQQSHSTVRFTGGAEATVQYTGFGHGILAYGREEDTERNEKLTGRPLVQAGQHGSGLLFNNMILRATFATGHAGQRATIKVLDGLVVARFPEVAYDTFDVQSGKTVADGRSVMFEDPAIAAWIKADENRMRFLRRGGAVTDEERPFLMLRPAG